MRACLAIFSVSIVVWSATATAQQNSRISWQHDGIVVAIHPDDLPQAKRRPGAEPELAQFAVTGEIAKADNRGSLEYNGLVDAEAQQGELLIAKSSDLSPMSFRWDLGFAAPHIALETASSKVVYPLTPVILPATSTFHNQPVIDLETLFPRSHQELSLVLNSPNVARVLPKTLIAAIRGNRSSSKQYSEQSAATRSYEEWSCGLVCGSAIGLGLFNVVGVGTLTPGAAIAAAGCGSCMGFIWGDHVTSQPPVNIPADGGGAPIGSFLPPLPPGWAWTCFANNSGGYTCVADETNGSYIPY